MASGTIKKANADIDVVTITATTQTGSGKGAADILKASYPQYKAIIPFGITTNLAYTVELFNSTSNSWRIGVRDVNTNAWVAETTVTFKAFGIK